VDPYVYRRLQDARRRMHEASAPLWRPRPAKKKGWTAKVLADFYDWEITLGEALFAVLIAGALTFCGFLIDWQVEKRVRDSQLRYRQAAEASSPEQFAWALDTDVGDLFAEGTVEAVDPVKFGRAEGEWLSYRADYQEHRMHTRVVTYTVTDAKGHTHVRHRTETYWSWDTYKTEHEEAERVSFLGREFKADEFDLRGVRRKYKTIDDGWRKRIEFSAVPKEASGAAFMTTAEGGKLKGKAEFTAGTTSAKLREDYTTSHASAVFWTLWILFTVGAVVAFFVIDNKWLD
jgi:hypothetical protein